MSQIIHQPSDKLFKKSMSDLRVAKDFFQQHLPQKIQRLIDFEQLKFQKNSYIDDAFKSSEADVVYSTQFQSKPGYLYLLLENQDKVDPLMPYRLMKYTFQIIDQHLKQKKDNILPLVYPMVFFSGAGGYTGSYDIFSLFGAHEALAKELFFGPFQLIDAKNIDDAVLKKHFWAGIMEFIYKHRALGDFITMAAPLIQWLALVEARGGYEYAEDMIKYILVTGEGDGINAVVGLAKQYLSKRLGGEAMTWAEQLEQRGREQCRHEIAVNLLASGMPLEQIAQITKLTQAEIISMSQRA